MNKLFIQHTGIVSVDCGSYRTSSNGYLSHDKLNYKTDLLGVNHVSINLNASGLPNCENGWLYLTTSDFRARCYLLLP